MTHIDLNRLRSNIERLGEIGSIPGEGTTRLSYSTDFSRGVNFVESLMKNAGLETRIDPVGNLIGKKKGERTASIVIGSHIDTVPNAGIFDGCLGVIAGIECIQVLNSSGYQNKHTLEVIAFTEEEGNVIGGTFGSKCLAGIELDEHYMIGLKKVGLKADDILMSRRNIDEIEYYIEMHIEQGGILDSEKITIGIVEGIVGIQRYRIVVNGIENHAGTTPMSLRKDALVDAAQMILRIDSLVRELNSTLVGTVGVLNVKPGAANVIPGQVEFILELRDMNESNMDNAIEKLKYEFSDKNMKVDCILLEEPTYMNPSVIAAMIEVCKNRNLNYKIMPSGAGHDSINMSKIAAAGMLFIPSIDGISHSKNERIRWEDLASGTEVMLDTLVHLDKSIG